jgi:photosystem II stability/assembly factor-like uncharacterized protein
MTVRSPRSAVPFVCLLALGVAACGDDTASFAPLSAVGGSDDDASSGGSASSKAGSSAAGRRNAEGGATSSAGNPTGGDNRGGTSASGGETTGTDPVECDVEPGAAPEMKWVNATGNLAGMESECGNLGLVSAQPCSARVIAGVAKKGLWETLDGGKTWRALGTSSASAKITNRISSIVFDPLSPEVFWESGIYNGGCAYKTTDSGATFTQLGEISHCDSISVDLSDPQRKTLLAGTHESNSSLHLSTNGGESWRNIAAGLPNGSCTSTLVVDAMTYLVGCNSGSIVRTTNGGMSWETAEGSSGGTFQPLVASDGTIYWPGHGGGISVSADRGKTFKTVADASLAPGIIAPAQLAELPDGRVVITGHEYLLASADQGEHWEPIGEKLPYPGGGYDGTHGVTYSAQTKTFFVWRWDCADKVPENAIMSMGFDWEAP